MTTLWTADELARASGIRAAAPITAAGVSIDTRTLRRGDLFIADNIANRVWRVDARDGRMDVFAGTGEPGYSGDGGAPEQAQPTPPGALATYLAHYLP